MRKDAWTPEEIALLNGLYSAPEVAAMTGRPAPGVYKKARALGLHLKTMNKGWARKGVRKKPTLKEPTRRVDFGYAPNPDAWHNVRFK